MALEAFQTTLGTNITVESEITEVETLQVKGIDAWDPSNSYLLYRRK